MRWEALFSDLEGQWAAARRAEDDALITDLAELEIGRTQLADRLRARVGDDLSLRLMDGHEVTGRVLDAAPEWLLLRSGERRSLVPVSAVAGAWPLSRVAPQAGVVESRLGMVHALRVIARQGAAVRLRTRAGDVRGRVVRVGADHLDVAPADRWSPGMPGVMSLSLAAVLLVDSE